MSIVEINGENYIPFPFPDYNIFIPYEKYADFCMQQATHAITINRNGILERENKNLFTQLGSLNERLNSFHMSPGTQIQSVFSPNTSIPNGSIDASGGAPDTSGDAQNAYGGAQDASGETQDASRETQDASGGAQLTLENKGPSTQKRFNGEIINWFVIPGRSYGFIQSYESHITKDSIWFPLFFNEMKNFSNIPFSYKFNKGSKVSFEIQPNPRKEGQFMAINVSTILV